MDNPKKGQVNWEIARQLKYTEEEINAIRLEALINLLLEKGIITKRELALAEGKVVVAQRDELLPLLKKLIEE